MSTAARIILSAGTALLVALFVWMAIRAVEPTPLIALPQVVVPAPPTPSATPSLARVPIAAGPSSSRPTRSSSPTPSRTPSRSPSALPSPSSSSSSPSASLSATLSVPASWEQGYVAQVKIRNTGASTRSWTVTVTHRNQQDLTLSNTWNATGRQSGDSLVFTGGSVAPGATVTFGYQVSKTGTGNARPEACTVVGGRCVVS